MVKVRAAAAVAGAAAAISYGSSVYHCGKIELFVKYNVATTDIVFEYIRHNLIFKHLSFTAFHILVLAVQQ